MKEGRRPLRVGTLADNKRKSAWTAKKVRSTPAAWPGAMMMGQGLNGRTRVLRHVQGRPPFSPSDAKKTVAEASANRAKKMVVLGAV